VVLALQFRTVPVGFGDLQNFANVSLFRPPIA